MTNMKGIGAASCACRWCDVANRFANAFYVLLEFDMQSLGPRSAITVILREHEQLSTVIEGMRRFVRLLAAGTPTPVSWCFGQCFITSGSTLSRCTILKRIVTCSRRCGIEQVSLTVR